VVHGGSANGLLAWKTKDGKTLGAYPRHARVEDYD